MTTRALGSLTVDLLLELAGFKEGMDKAQRETEKTAAKMRGLAREGDRLAKSLATPLEQASALKSQFLANMSHGDTEGQRATG